MVAQVIFFLALALLIVLIVRRVSVNTKILLQLRSMVTLIGRNMVGWGQRAGGSVVEQARKVSGFRSQDGVGFSLKSKNPTPFAAGNSGFWQEEPISEKIELSSNFEEGDSLFKEGKYDEAEQFFLKAATSNPAQPKIYARLGVIYLNKKNYNDAIESLKVAVKLDKYNPSRHYNLALAYWGNKDKQRATISVREAIGLDPVTPKYRQFLETLLESK